MISSASSRSWKHVRASSPDSRRLGQVGLLLREGDEVWWSRPRDGPPRPGASRPVARAPTPPGRGPPTSRRREAGRAALRLRRGWTSRARGESSSCSSVAHAGPARRPGPGWSGRPRPSMVTVTTSSARSVKLSSGTMPVPVSRTTPSGKDVAAVSHAPRSADDRVSCLVSVAPWNATSPPRSIGEVDGKRLVRDPHRHDGRAEGARAVVDLGLRQVEGVLDPRWTGC